MSSPDLEERIAGHRRRGELSPGWSPARFAAFEPRVRRLDRALAHASNRERIVDAYLRVVAEAVAEERAGEDSLFGGLLERLPEALVAVGDDAVALLARTFNLADGALEELPWLGGYLAAGLSECADLSRFDAHLVTQVSRALGEGLALSEPPSADVAMDAEVISMRPSIGDLLPGRMSLLAPRVLSVADRFAPSRVAGLLVLGPGEVHRTSPLRGSRLPSSASLPVEASVVHEEVTLSSGARFRAAGLTEIHSCLAAPAGFVAVTAVDSQRVWIAQPRAAR